MDSGWLKEAQVQLYSPGGANLPRWHSAVSCTKTVEAINLPFGLWIWVGRTKHEFSCIRHVAPMCPPMRAHWRPNVPSHEGTLAPHGQYDWTICLHLQCGLMSNDCDHLFSFSDAAGQVLHCDIIITWIFLVVSAVLCLREQKLGVGRRTHILGNLLKI